MKVAVDYQLSEEFWRRFVAEGNIGKPVLIKQPLEGLIMSPQESFDLFVRASDLERQYRRQELQVFFNQGQKQADFFDLLPFERDQTFEGYASRLEALPGFDAFTLFSLNSHRLDRPLFNRARVFMKGLFEEYGLPQSGAMSDMFFGKYPASPIGIHKDSTSNFSFVLQGMKRYVFWPKSCFQFAPVLDNSRGTLFNTDYESQLQDAIVIDAYPGDIVYWPVTYWHMAVNGDWVVTMNLGFDERNLTFATPLRALFRDLEFLGDDGLRRPGDFKGSDIPKQATKAPSELQTLVGAIQEKLQTPSFLEDVTSLELERLSAFGFERPPDANDEMPGLEPEDFVRADVRFPVIHARCGEKIILAVNGHAASIEYAANVERLIDSLNSGRSFRVSELCEQLERTDDATNGTLLDAETIVDILNFLRSAGSIVD